MGRPVPWDRGDLYLTERHDGIVKAADADARVALCRLAADRSCEFEPGMRLAILSEIHWTGDDRADLWVWDVVLEERYIHTSVIAVTVDRKDDARWEFTRWDPFFFES